MSLLLGSPAPLIVASANFQVQGANLTLLNFVVPFGMDGIYNLYGYTMVTQAATVSSTLPALRVTYTDNNTLTSIGPVTILSSNNGNTVGTFGNQAVAPHVINCEGGTSILIDTASFATAGATSMQFACGVKLIYLGTGS